MENIVFCAVGTEKITENELIFMKNNIPQSRTAKSERYRLDSDRKNCIASYFLLLCLLSEKYNTDNIPEIYTGEYGKPYFRESDIFFNISHCKDAVCCAVSKCNIGVDIQEKTEEYTDILDAVFSESEKQDILNSEYSSELCTRFWTQKEAYLKYKATGLTNDIRKYDFSPYKDGYFKFADGFISTETYKNYSISVCCERGKADIVISDIGEYIRNYKLRNRNTI